MAQQVHVQLELLARRGELEHGVVHLLKRRAVPEQPESHPHARHVRIHRNVAHPEREQKHAGRGLAPDTGQRAEILLGLSWWSEDVSVIAARMSLIRADLTFEIPPGRIAASTSSTGASRISSQRDQRSRSPR